MQSAWNDVQQREKESIEIFENLHAVRFTFNPKLDDERNASNI